MKVSPDGNYMLVADTVNNAIVRLNANTGVFMSSNKFTSVLKIYGTAISPDSALGLVGG